MSLADELREIMRLAAAEDRLIDSVFPQPEPHVLVLDGANIPKRTEGRAILTATPQDNGQKPACIIK